MRAVAEVITRAATGHYRPDVLATEEREVGELGDGDVLVRAVYVSLDPTNRNWLKLESPNTLADKIGVNLRVGDVMMGQLLGVVEESRSPRFRPGNRVAALGPWQERFILPEQRLRSIVLEDEPFSSHLTVFSHVGLAAYAGMVEVAAVAEGETVLVSGAAGATGSIAVGIAKDRGCRVIGVAGGPRKCAYVRDVLKADAVVDHREDELAAALAAAASGGIDAYFDNVGGRVLDAALQTMKLRGRIAVCGLMAHYDAPESRLPVYELYQVLVRALTIRGFHAEAFRYAEAEAFAELRRLLRAGTIQHRPQVFEGLPAAPEALGLLFNGGNDGKLIVRVSPE